MNSTSPTSPIDRDEIHRLLCGLVDNELSGDERAHLEQLLAEDPEVRAEYREFMCLESLLTWNIAGDEQRLRLAPLPPNGDSGSPTSQHRRIAAWLLPLVASTLAAASILVMVFARSEAPPAAMLTAEDNAVWRGGERPAQGRPLPSGALGLTAGTAQITFPSGAVVAVHAGAEFELLGPNRLLLRAGRVTPYVPPSAKGFTVVSPGGEIVDFGTEFTVGVDRDGRTDVFVIEGEVDVAGGHLREEDPVRLTQGFASQFTAVERTPVITQRPLVIDHFDADDGPLRRTDVDSGKTSRVIDGWLNLPIAGVPSTDGRLGRVVLDDDFSALAGKLSTISFKVMLPDTGTAPRGRWLAFVIDEGVGETPMAFDPEATAAVLMSPLWQAGMRFHGESHYTKMIFPRFSGSEGLYQVVMTIDDRPEARANHGGAAVTLMINGLEFVSQRPIHLGSSTRLSFQTYPGKQTGGPSQALVDDFSVSIHLAGQPNPLPENQ
jgi:ferric-dicitrate binding protein FerR (iron transport regulator)